MKTACRIPAGGHRGKVLFVDRRQDILGLVHDQQQAGGGAHHVGLAVPAQERDPAVSDHAHEVGTFLPAFFGQQVGVQPVLEAQDGLDGLGFVGGVDFHDAAVAAGELAQQENLQVRQQLILAGLARHDHHEIQPPVEPDAVQDGGGRFELVAAQAHAAAFPGEIRKAAQQAPAVFGQFAHACDQSSSRLSMASSMERSRRPSRPCRLALPRSSAPMPTEMRTRLVSSFRSSLL